MKQVKSVDPTIKEPIDDFIDEIEKAVESFKKRLHNGNERNKEELDGRI